MYCCDKTSVVTLILIHMHASCLKIDYGCGEPPSVENAELIPNQQMKSSVALYRCKEGYFKTGGEEIMSCYWNNQEKSEWDSSSPLDCREICKAKPIILGMQPIMFSTILNKFLCENRTQTFNLLLTLFKMFFGHKTFN